MKKVFLIFLYLISLTAFSQDKYFTRTGHISFYSDAPLDKIEANNYQVTSFLSSDGGFVFSVLIKGFQFEKAKMQDDFNANYLESDKFPKATFDGKITNINEIDLKKDGEYDAKVEGKLTIHGVTKEIKESGKIKVSGGKIKATSSFKIRVKDYNIKIPTLVTQKIAEVVDVKVDLTYDPYKK